MHAQGRPRPSEQATLTASQESAVPRRARSRVTGGEHAPGCTPGGISQLMAAVDSDDSVCGRAHANRVLRWSSVSTCARAPRMRRRARPVAAPLLCHAGLAAATVLSCVSLLQIGQEARRRGVQRQAAQQQALCTRRTAAAPGAQAACSGSRAGRARPRPIGRSRAPCATHHPHHPGAPLLREAAVAHTNPIRVSSPLQG